MFIFMTMIVTSKCHAGLDLFTRRLSGFAYFEYFAVHSVFYYLSGHPKSVLKFLNHRSGWIRRDKENEIRSHPVPMSRISEILRAGGRQWQRCSQTRFRLASATSAIRSQGRILIGGNFRMRAFAGGIVSFDVGQFLLGLAEMVSVCKSCSILPLEFLRAFLLM